MKPRKLKLELTVEEVGALYYAAVYTDQHDDELRSESSELSEHSDPLESAMGKLFSVLKR